MAGTKSRKSNNTVQSFKDFSKSSATSRVQLAEKAFRVTGFEPNNPDIISVDCYSSSLVTLAPLDNNCTVAVAPEENEVSPSTSR
ncbi:hypothetical protein AVEN_21620-1 [Araneus ventricosus]|uniref:Uncharacterized protein n=1 Tax=Araneus ventricosus TaxID=182803 RepID=A0A4Y2G8A1_ARAVE|nr:hypothetical protein AVEN_21620-1 [Araneus ventricosus]